MRQKVSDSKALIINTCGKNDSTEKGTFISWVWSNPTNRAIIHKYEGIQSVSVECLWQGTKIRKGMDKPDEVILNGNWRGGKGKKPIGAWAGYGNQLITTPGEARRKIYLPAYINLIGHWLNDDNVLEWIKRAKSFDGPVYLRDFDTGKGLDRNGPMSHAWVLSMWLNSGSWDWIRS